MLNVDRYVGNSAQLFGVEESRLVGGRGDGMRLLSVSNGAGICFTVSADRCADISRLSYMSRNLGYFAPCGYVASQFYDGKGAGFLKSFTAGFLTTCGLTAVGSPCVDDGEELPLHGTIGNTPSERISTEITEDAIRITATVRDAALFGTQYLLERTYDVPLFADSFRITDRVTNISGRRVPFMMLYHFNMGYPLLDENAEVYIPGGKVEPRNARAAEGLDRALEMEPPQRGFEEQCYYHKVRSVGGTARAGIFNRSLGTGVMLEYGAEALDFFTEWKMMGEREYVLGLEPGNCSPDGRDVMRKNGKLRFLDPGESAEHRIKVRILTDVPDMLK